MASLGQGQATVLVLLAGSRRGLVMARYEALLRERDWAPWVVEAGVEDRALALVLVMAPARVWQFGPAQLLASVSRQAGPFLPHVRPAPEHESPAAERRPCAHPP